MFVRKVIAEYIIEFLLSFETFTTYDIDISIMITTATATATISISISFTPIYLSGTAKTEVDSRPASPLSWTEIMNAKNKNENENQRGEIRLI